MSNVCPVLCWVLPTPQTIDVTVGITKVISPSFRIGVEKQKLHVKIKCFLFRIAPPLPIVFTAELEWCLLSVYVL